MLIGQPDRCINLYAECFRNNPRMIPAPCLARRITPLTGSSAARRLNGGARSRAGLHNPEAVPPPITASQKTYAALQRKPVTSCNKTLTLNLEATLPRASLLLPSASPPPSGAFGDELPKAIGPAALLLPAVRIDGSLFAGWGCPSRFRPRLYGVSETLNFHRRSRHRLDPDHRHQDRRPRPGLAHIQDRFRCKRVLVGNPKAGERPSTPCVSRGFTS